MGRHISIHALLAESDREPTALRTPHHIFLSTLSLRRATAYHFMPINGTLHFYPRSPCGERLRVLDGSKSSIEISIHALLAESDIPNFRRYIGSNISIHALLAESDCTMTITICTAWKFLSTLSLRRATFEKFEGIMVTKISIHALLAESDKLYINNPTKPIIFLSTLSLRRATRCFNALQSLSAFLSTLSLRRATWPGLLARPFFIISIHALLAESDGQFSAPRISKKVISIHALLAESDSAN